MTDNSLPLGAGAVSSGVSLPVIAPASDAAAVQRAATAVRAGRLLGLPTETVYGLAADADQADAVASIFSAKGCPPNHPLIVHLASFDGGMSGVAHYAASVPPFARQLMAAFWPGPLTLIVPRRPGVAAAAAGGQDSVGLRCPDHPVAQAVLYALRHPAQGEAVVWGLAAPSANRFGRVSPTSARHVQSEFAEVLGDQLLILDGGDCDVGIESTIIDCTRGAPVLLRPGAITGADVVAACGQELLSPQAQAALQEKGHVAPRASGTLASHYAPSARVRLLGAAALQSALDSGSLAVEAGVVGEVGEVGEVGVGVAVAVYARSPLRLPALLASAGGAAGPVAVTLRTMPADAAVAAHELFSVLRELDALRVAEIWVESPPAGVAWDGVRDRLQRAAA